MAITVTRSLFSTRAGAGHSDDHSVFLSAVLHGSLNTQVRVILRDPHGHAVVRRAGAVCPRHM